MFYVYAYFEKGYAEPFYIGKGTGGNRATRHLEPSTYSGCHDRFHRKVKNLIEQGIIPEVEYLGTGLTENESITLERRLIERFGRLEDGGCLLNHTDGGEGVTGYIHTEESKAKIRAGMSGKQNALGTIMDTRRPIKCLTLGTVVKTYDFVSQVEKDGYRHQNVVAVLKGRRKFAYGFEWEYA